MSISALEISNFKSIKNLKMSFKEINFLLGHNGAGKTNILKAINYFYNNLTEVKIDHRFFDNNNPYSKYFEISITYDLAEMHKRFVKILHNIETKATSIDESEKFLHDKQLKQFINRFLFYVILFCKDKEVKFTLRQYKDNRQEWRINNVFVEDKSESKIKKLHRAIFDFRSLIKNMFPLYYTDARHINLTNWEYIWRIISDLSKLHVKDTFRQEMNSKLMEILDTRYVNTTKSIDKSLKDSNIQVKDFNYNEITSLIYKMHTFGDKFRFNNNDLDYFSDGMNSFNYMGILVALTSNITSLKLKEPLIIIDEPEVGLYPKLIDEFSDKLISKSKQQQVIVSTHSPRLIMNVLKRKTNIGTIYHVVNERKYTTIRKIRELLESKEKYRMSEKEASYYFSRAILFVEGETELELFQNDNLVKLFPVLKQIDISLGGANDVMLELCNPQKRNTNIAYLILLDLDKILRFRYKDKNQIVNRFEIKNEKINPLSQTNTNNHKSERYLYGVKRNQTLTRREVINSMIETNTFPFDTNWFYSEDHNFNNLKDNIRDYCINYNVFIVDNTIEGTIINRNNHAIAYDWMMNSDNIKVKNNVQAIYSYNNNEAYKTTVLRLIHSGKYDNLEKIYTQNQIKNNLTEKSDRSIYNKIYQIKKSKTSGWVSEFLNYYFKNYINNKQLDSEGKRRIFKQHFQELHSIITFFEKNLSKNQGE